VEGAKEAEEAEAGSAEVKLTGTPAAQQKARNGLKELKGEADSSGMVDWVDTSMPPPGTECAICLCEIDPAERHLMEPCLHAYHQVTKRIVRVQIIYLEQTALQVTDEQQASWEYTLPSTTDNLFHSLFNTKTML
jgi:hypothetical protein